MLVDSNVTLPWMGVPADKPTKDRCFTITTTENEHPAYKYFCVLKTLQTGSIDVDSAYGSLYAADFVSHYNRMYRRVKQEKYVEKLSVNEHPSENLPFLYAMLHNYFHSFEKDCNA